MPSPEHPKQLFSSLYNIYPLSAIFITKEALTCSVHSFLITSPPLATCGLTGHGAELFLLLNCRSSSWVGRCHYKTSSIQYIKTLCMGGQMPAHKTLQNKQYTVAAASKHIRTTIKSSKVTTSCKNYQMYI